MRKIRTVDTVTKICEWCNTEFTVAWAKRNQKLCTRKCMYEQRKDKNWEEVVCKGCNTLFKRRKKDRHYRSNKKRMFCSNKCSLTSDYKKRKLRKWGLSDKNHWNNKSVQDKVKTTKLRLYGDANYNNMSKYEASMLAKYGVRSGFQLNKSNGIRISKPQRKVFKTVKKMYKDAILEHYLEDAGISVDIYIPKSNTVIEIQGDYWHMNPSIYSATDYNKNMHMTAKEVWQRDKERIVNLKGFGYNIISIWETDINNDTYKSIII